MTTRQRVIVAALATSAVVVVALIVAELVLPGIAAQRVRDRVDRYGSVRAVSVHAQPALELLWGDAETIGVRAGPLHVTPADLVELEQRVSGVGSAELTTPELVLSLAGLASAEVPLYNVRLVKHGKSLLATGLVRPANVHATLIAGFQAQGFYAESGRPEVGISGEVLGARLSARGLVTASEGKIIVEPVGIPFGSLAAVSVFSDPRIDVESVTAAPQGEEVLLTVHARPAS
jgi:hypothetical protein